MVGPIRLPTNIVMSRLFSAPYLHLKDLVSDSIKVRDDSRNVIQRLDDELLNQLNEIIEEYIPRIENQMDTLANRIDEYMKYHEDRVENISEITLRRILNDWINERRRMNDISEEDITSTTIDILDFINNTHNHIEYAIRGDRPTDSIHRYMSGFNSRLFDVISGRPSNSNEPRNLYDLNEPYIELLVMMRWIQNSDQPMNTGITIDDLVSDFDSLLVNERMRSDLQSILSSQ